MRQEQGWQFLLNRPASERDIARCEAVLGRSLPASYRAFLLRWDGASLFRQETQIWDGQRAMTAEIGIAGAQRLAALNAELRVSVDVPLDHWGSLIVFCAIPGAGAYYCGLNPEVSTNGEDAVVDCHEDYSPQCWRRAVIAPSFETWLDRIFDAVLRAGDPYYWFAMPELAALYRQCHEEAQGR